jgi:hypothetical protein
MSLGVHLDDALQQACSVLPKFGIEEIKTGFSEFAYKVADAEQTLGKVLPRGGADVYHFREAFAQEIERRALKLRQGVLPTSPEEGDVHMADLEGYIDKVLEKIEGVFVDIAMSLQVDKDSAQNIFNDIKKPLKHIIVIIGIRLPYSSFYGLPSLFESKRR